MISKRWLISGLGQKMHKIILRILNDRNLRDFKDQWGLDRKFRTPHEKAKHLPVYWAE